MDCLSRLMEVGKSTVSKVSNMVPTSAMNMLQLDESRMVGLKNDLIKVGLSSVAVSFFNNTLTQRTLTHEIGCKFAGLALYHVALAKKVEEYEASHEMLKKVNFSLTVKLTVVSLVSTALLSGVGGFNAEQVMKDFVILAASVAVYSMVVSKLVAKLGLAGDKQQIAGDWAGVITITTVSELIKANGDLSATLTKLTNMTELKNMVSNILGRNLASAVDYS